jgi:hypothetical protein
MHSSPQKGVESWTLFLNGVYFYQNRLTINIALHPKIKEKGKYVGHSQGTIFFTHHAYTNYQFKKPAHTQMSTNAEMTRRPPSAQKDADYCTTHEV